MKTVQCDRCDKVLSFMQHNELVVRNTSGVSIGGDIEADLCPSCTHALKDFLSTGL